MLRTVRFAAPRLRSSLVVAALALVVACGKSSNDADFGGSGGAAGEAGSGGGGAGGSGGAAGDAGGGGTGGADAGPDATTDGASDAGPDATPDADGAADAPVDAPPGCGDGVIQAGEQCDDGGHAAGDGCSPACEVEAGWTCVGSPSTCSTLCGDGIRVGGEPCDDGDHDPGDGCSPICDVEPGWTCAGSPSACATTCGDGVVAGAETCDDGAKDAGDGCSASCALEAGWTCSGAPTVCAPKCGDGLLVGGEACDDGNQNGGDCCSSTCHPETGCEIEANDAIASANDLFGLAPSGKIKAFIRPGSDVDEFFFDVPAGSTGSVDVATTDGPLGTTCASNKLDSKVFLTDGNGAVFASDDDGGGGFCSKLHRDGLAPGRWYVKVALSPLSSQSLSFDYTLDVALSLATCADGVLQPGEPCDDGNHANGDGCSSTCRLEPSPEIEPNGSCASATAASKVPVLFAGAISPGTDVDLYTFTLPYRADVAITAWDPQQTGDCTATQVAVQLLPAACGAALADDSPFSPECAHLDASNEPGARQLAPGTYAVSVAGKGGSATPSYALEIRPATKCGNGIVEGFEPCDGGSKCKADCTRVPTCGDGFVDAPEQCDDGGTASGDGCSSTCKVEAVAEVEPNDNTQQAAAAIGPVTASTRFAGAIASSSDWDYYGFTLAQPRAVRIELFDATGRDCGASIGSGTYLDVMTSDGQTVLGVDQYGGGIGNCPAIVAWYPAGTYFARLGNGSATSSAPYVLQIAIEADGGAESEPNETVQQASAAPGIDVYVAGSRSATADVDTFAITVPAGKSIRAEIIEGSGSPTCESNDLDSYLTLLGPGGATLGTDDDGGRGYCSMIDGTGASPADPWAHVLAAGTYYVQVTASPSAQPAAATFAYRLVVTVR